MVLVKRKRPSTNRTGERDLRARPFCIRCPDLGATKSVLADRLSATDAVEQIVVDLQESKRKLAEAILGQGRVGLRDMTKEELEQLLS